MAKFEAGMRVLYSPELIHAHGAFGYVYDGGRYTSLFNVVKHPDPPAGTGEIKSVVALLHWDAKILRVNDDGTCDLEVYHPNGRATMYLPDRAPYSGPLPEPPGYLPPEDRIGVRYDKKKTPHTFHLAGD